jgi:hypothetical protein
MATTYHTIITTKGAFDGFVNGKATFSDDIMFPDYAVPDEELQETVEALKKQGVKIVDIETRRVQQFYTVKTKKGLLYNMAKTGPKFTKEGYPYSEIAAKRHASRLRKLGYKDAVVVPYVFK